VSARQTILLFDLPQMIGDLIEGVLTDDSVQVVRARGDFLGTVARLRPDVAVLHPDGSDGAITSLLADPPRMRVLVVDREERHAALYDLDPADGDRLPMKPDKLRSALQIGEPVG
jgi:hypothetical protein